MKNIRKTAVLFIILVTGISCFLLMSRDRRDIPENAILEAFNRSGANLVTAELYFRGILEEEEYTDIEQMKKLAAEFVSALGLEENPGYSQKIIDNDVLRELEVSGMLRNEDLSGGSALATLRILRTTSENRQDKGYILLDIVRDQDGRGMTETRKRVEAIFSKIGILPKVNTCLSGSLDGKLSTGEMNNVCKLVFTGIKAKKVEGLSDRNLISVCAYSPEIEDYIKVKDQKVNLNLAIRYNSFEDKTYIWLATPVITVEY